jgi:hypothetical protein
MATVRRRWVIVIVMILGSFVLGAAMAWTILRSPFPVIGAGAGVLDKPQEFFTINADLADPMYPGGSAPLDLTITNPLDTNLGVSRLVVEIDEVDAPNATASHPCEIDDFTIVQLSDYEELIVEPQATATLAELGVPREDWPHVHMLDLDHNQDGCKNATFSLAYSAVGRIVE